MNENELQQIMNQKVMHQQQHVKQKTCTMTTLLVSFFVFGGVFVFFDMINRSLSHMFLKDKIETMILGYLKKYRNAQSCFILSVKHCDKCIMINFKMK